MRRKPRNGLALPLQGEAIKSRSQVVKLHHRGKHGVVSEGVSELDAQQTRWMTNELDESCDESDEVNLMKANQ